MQHTTAGLRSAPRRDRRRRLALMAAAALVCVGLLPIANASASNSGSGEVNGQVHFTQPIPALNYPCATTSFTIQNATAEVVAVNSAIVGYIGSVPVSGNGGSSCEAASSGSGTLTLTDVHGNGVLPNNTLDCANSTKSPPTTLTGGYTRNGPDVEAVLGGTCIVNGFSAQVQFIFRGEFVPTNSQGGTVNPITDATFAGPFVVS